MKNDKQIAFTQLSLHPFWGKFVTIIQHPKPTCGMSESAFYLCRIFYPRHNL